MIDAANPLLRGDLRNFEDFPLIELPRCGGGQ
jgi:hypothetical protein